MKYNEKAFYHAISYYKEKLKGKVEEKTVFVLSDLKNKEAFYSIAPLSRAVHELNGDMHVIVEDKGFSNSHILSEIWHIYYDSQRKLKTKKVKALSDFIKSVDKRTNTKVFKEIFKKPEIVLHAKKGYFKGTIDLNYHFRWHRKYKFDLLLKTTEKILKQGFALNKKDILNIGFVLIPKKEDIELPLEDYLDSYSISLAIGLSAKKLKAKISLGAVTDRFSLLARPVRTADLLATIKGCYLDKDIDEEVFKKFKILSKLLKLERLNFQTAGFGIHAKGFFGKHFFGDEIGYPTLNKKTRWSSPGQIMLKDPFSPQTKFETRDPMMRYAITETLPIDTFIETCNINYNTLRKTSDKIRNIFNKCKHIRVVGKTINSYKTDFIVELLDEKGKRRDFISSDCDVKNIIDKQYFHDTGIKAGTFANFPSGEAFCTPERVRGTLIGDVVINIDQSHIIPENEPIIVEFANKGYKLIKVPSKIRKVMTKTKREAWQKIKNYEKSKALPKEVIQIYKRNFKSVGEFAVNTNPKAKLSNYLIVNEKIARMIHIALGAGFEPDKKTLYHWDIVVNSPKQKLDVYGVDKKNKVYWVIKKGELVV
jgi:hypothetical protein